MYHVELSEAALNDLRDFNAIEATEILNSLHDLETNPKPNGVQIVPVAEAADGIAYFFETIGYSVYYNIFEIANLIKVVAVFKKMSLN